MKKLFGLTFLAIGTIIILPAVMGNWAINGIGSIFSITLLGIGTVLVTGRF